MSESIFDAYIPHRPKRLAGGPLGPSFRGASHEIREVSQSAKPQNAMAEEFQSFYVDEDALLEAQTRVCRAELMRLKAFNRSEPTALSSKNPSDEWRQPGTRRVEKSAPKTPRFSRN